MPNSTHRALLLFPFLPFLSKPMLTQAQQRVPADTTRQKVTLGEVVVAASKVEESFLQSPVTVEKLSARQLRLTPAPSFFDAIEHLKGVQVITPSLSFKVINARGFTNTTNVRFAQLVDGIDNQAPHIGGPIGNVLGPSDLDISSVEIVPGTAAALYGLNAINGLANFSTRNPFRSEGLSVQQKVGINHLHDPSSSAKLFSETSVRYAKVLAHKLAFKVNGTYLRGYDWIANDQTELNPNGNATTGLFGTENPARDQVNRYGNESSNRSTLTLGGKSYQVARTGYNEQEVVDYQLQTIKYDAALHYKLGGSAELAYTYRGTVLDNVYQRSNRFRLEDYHLQQHALQLTTPVVQARAYLTTENTGKSYNLRSAAENLDRSYKADTDWNREYSTAWNAATTNGQTVAQAHATARAAADAGRLQPGTAEFKQRLAELADINNWDAGAALRVKADLVHAEGQVNLAEALRRGGTQLPANYDVLVGADHRTYLIQPDGNYFINPESGKDPLRDNLTYSKTGGFVQAGARLLDERIRLTATLRADKNDYFSMRFNPRFTAVYSPTRQHNFRVSYQSGYRFPSLFEGFSNVNSGQVKRIGGLRVMSDGVFENSYLRSSIDGFNAAVTRDRNTNGQTLAQAIASNQGQLVKTPYTYLKPEHINSLEAGYKAALLSDGRLLADVDFYYNTYRDFIAQVEAYVPVNAAGEPLNPGTDLNTIATALNARAGQARYRLWTNSQSQVYNYGGSLGLRYDVAGGYLAGAGVTYTRLDRTESGDGLEDGFNTPRWAYNLSVGNEKVVQNFGFGLNYRWQARYYSQTFLVNGYVPAYHTLDAQLSYTVPTPNLRFKLGASNLLNNYYVSYLGGPSVGGLYYLQVTYGL
ncbi:TonB-dependent receptor [Hymenobacter sp. BT186]|uniref:TonB-dependent receptor n=1 Tax=Hymenobacter telluris TaxID=2816474 RepID=A0A939EV67_9BACT|nr:TonB-dependent receptor [Hymenobacter telluris]MBO0358110.1 TonB-dependent receptor [Hymenobacter telluris]MBW3374137.1 TonB-dependent receptor [Hymenobacter norwichensis]